jgi:hypothetical protein
LGIIGAIQSFDRWDNSTDSLNSFSNYTFTKIDARTYCKPQYEADDECNWCYLKHRLHYKEKLEPFRVKNPKVCGDDKLRFNQFF